MNDVPIIEMDNLEPTSTGFIPTVMAEMRQEFDARLEDGAYNAVCEVGFKVDKEELMKLLRGDRKSYDKGYEDGRRDAVKHGHWITEDDGFWCSKCHAYANWLRRDYCPDCGAKMDEEC